MLLIGSRRRLKGEAKEAASSFCWRVFRRVYGVVVVDFFERQYLLIRNSGFLASYGPFRCEQLRFLEFCCGLVLMIFLFSRCSCKRTATLLRRLLLLV